MMQCSVQDLLHYLNKIDIGDEEWERRMNSTQILNLEEMDEIEDNFEEIKEQLREIHKDKLNKTTRELNLLKNNEIFNGGRVSTIRSDCLIPDFVTTNKDVFNLPYQRLFPGKV
jgi:hypothetical protein